MVNMSLTGRGLMPGTGAVWTTIQSLWPAYRLRQPPAPGYDPISIELCKTNKDINEFVNENKKSGVSTAELEKAEKKGFFTGLYATNPINGKSIPVWISNYVLMGYGEGAIMAVPAHDDRDFEFAQKYSLDVIQVIESEKELYTGKGTLINSEDFNGLSSDDAID